MSAFDRFVERAVLAFGSRFTLLATVVLLTIWLSVGAHFQWSSTWQLVVNDPLSIFAWIAAVLILNKQIGDAAVARKRDEAMHRKLDAVIAALDKADNRLIGCENVE